MKNSISIKSITNLLLPFLLSTNTFNTFGQESNHTCGAGNVHNPAITYGQVADIDGNTYRTVAIDDLVWFAENLKVTRFQNGDLIPAVSDSADWSRLTGPGMCSYRNDTTFDCPYGKLYNFFVASDSRNPCPAGWRVPSLSDYNKLINFFDPDANGGAPSSLPNSAGGYLKSTGLSYWQSPNINATNLSGFSAVPNGGRNNTGVFSFGNKLAASYWYSSQVGPGMGFFLELAYTQDYAVRNAYFAKYGICIRCVTDVSTLNSNDVKPLNYYIFPNPATESIQMITKSLSPGQEYIIHDLTGRIMLKGMIHSENTSIIFSDLPSGMYLLRYPASNGGFVKIIKQ